MAGLSFARIRHPGWLAGAVVAAATAVLAVVAVLDYVRPPDARGTGPPVAPHSPRTEPGPTGGSSPTGSTAATPVATDLAELTLVSGASSLAPLPEELAGELGDAQAVVIACPSNQTGDRINEVTYETRYLYSTLDAELRPYRDPPDNVLVNLQIFSDPQDREPGAALPGESRLEQLRMGESATVQGVDIGDAYYLRLRVECEKPNGFLIMTGAVVHPAS